LRSPKIRYQKYFFVSYELLEEIVRLKVTVDDIAFVDVIQRDAYHSENTNYIFFWKKFLGCIDNILKTLIAFFHNNAREIIFIFDNVNEFANHWMLKRPHSAYFTLSFSQ
jgi:hypothetical protein